MATTNGLELEMVAVLEEAVLERDKKALDAAEEAWRKAHGERTVLLGCDSLEARRADGMRALAALLRYALAHVGLEAYRNQKTGQLEFRGPEDYGWLRRRIAEARAKALLRK